MNEIVLLLESLHSGLIDVITEAHPDVKPELGLPKSDTQWCRPSDEITSFVVVWSRLGEHNVAIFIGTEESFSASAGYGCVDLWEKVKKISEPDFERHGIAPELGEPREFESRNGHQPFQGIGKQIWIPMKLGDLGNVYLGLGY